MEARKLLLPLWGPVFPEVSFPRSLRRQLYNASPILLAPGVHLTPLLSHSGFPLSLHLPGVSFREHGLGGPGAGRRDGCRAEWRTRCHSCGPCPAVCKREVCAPLEGPLSMRPLLTWSRARPTPAQGGFPAPQGLAGPYGAGCGEDRGCGLPSLWLWGCICLSWVEELSRSSSLLQGASGNLVLNCSALLFPNHTCSRVLEWGAQVGCQASCVPCCGGRGGLDCGAQPCSGSSSGAQCGSRGASRIWVPWESQCRGSRGPCSVAAVSLWEDGGHDESLRV